MNDKILAYVRTGYLLLVGSVLGWLADRGIDIPIDALNDVLWPLVTFIYYVASREFSERVGNTQLARVLNGPGPSPTYEQVIEGLTGEKP